MRKTILALLLAASASLVLATTANLPTVEILATGGTIAGTASSELSTTYKAGSLTGKQLIASVPGLDSVANIEPKQVYNKDSGDITLNDWLKLAAEVDQAAANPAINGMVITHGTDTMEETAYFLQLIAKTSKPIVLVGAMRPATSLSADGPLNLYNAVAVAADPAAANRGVLVAMNEEIFDGRNVSKTNTTRVDAFQAPNSGAVGHVLMGKVSFQNKVSRPHTSQTPFNLSGVRELPQVAIIYEYAGVNTEMLTNILKTKDLKGIVIAGVGDGNIPNYESSFLIQARKQGIVIVRSSRVGSGNVSYNYNNLDTTYGLVADNDLNPEKARILLMLSLLTTSDIKQIQQNFNTY